MVKNIVPLQLFVQEPTTDEQDLLHRLEECERELQEKNEELRAIKIKLRKENAAFCEENNTLQEVNVIYESKIKSSIQLEARALGLTEEIKKTEQLSTGITNSAVHEGNMSYESDMQSMKLTKVATLHEQFKQSLLDRLVESEKALKEKNHEFDQIHATNTKLLEENTALRNDNVSKFELELLRVKSSKMEFECERLKAQVKLRQEEYDEIYTSMDLTKKQNSILQSYHDKTERGILYMYHATKKLEVHCKDFDKTSFNESTSVEVGQPNFFDAIVQSFLKKYQSLLDVYKSTQGMYRVIDDTFHKLICEKSKIMDELKDERKKRQEIELELGEIQEIPIPWTAQRQEELEFHEQLSYDMCELERKHDQLENYHYDLKEELMNSHITNQDAKVIHAEKMYKAQLEIQQLRQERDEAVQQRIAIMEAESIRIQNKEVGNDDDDDDDDDAKSQQSLPQIFTKGHNKKRKI